MTDQSITRLQRMSKNFRLLFTILIYLVPIMVLTYWLMFNQLTGGFTSDLPSAPHGSLSLAIRTMAFLVTLLPMSVAVYGMVTLGKLFRLYENAIIFSKENVLLFRKLGYIMIAWVGASIVFTPFISTVMVMGNSEGPNLWTVSFGTPDIAGLIMGALVVFISKVMDEGRKLEDEQIHTV